MKAIGSLLIAAGAAFLLGCGGTAPVELTNARQAYGIASQGLAVTLAPAELHTAEVALARAEKSYKDDKKSYLTRDLAYVAQRRAEMAEAQASIAAERENGTQANNTLLTTQGDMLQSRTKDLDDARNDLALSEQARLAATGKSAEQESQRRASEIELSRTRAALAASEQSGMSTSAQLATERVAREAAEQKSAESLSAISKLTASRADERGDIFTISGALIFRSNEAVLMPGAETQLDRLVEALASTPDRNVLVEGYTDSQGSAEHNLDLSQRRADAVRNYLMRRGYAAHRVQAHGIGEASPIADNATSEGRANNRRVEIVLEYAAKQ